MKLRVVKNNFAKYLRKIGKTKEDYNNSLTTKASDFYFYVDREDIGKEQNINILFGQLDEKTSKKEIENICVELEKEGYKNITVYQYKRYYTAGKGKLSFMRFPNDICVKVYKFL